jgi:hypothetical protein
MDRDDDSLRPPDPFIAEALAGGVDFYCFGCGYNLRGLAGDPKRCPECGEVNPVKDLIVTAEMIRRQLKRLETAPTLCIAGILVTAAGMPGLVATFTAEGPFCYGVWAIVGPFLWLCAMARFAETCQWKSGWGKALARFHLYAFYVFAVVIGAPVVLWPVLVALGNRMGSLSSIGACWVASLVSALVFGVLLRTVGPLLYHQATAGFEPLQRQVAMDLARQAHRTRIARQRRSPR